MDTFGNRSTWQTTNELIESTLQYYRTRGFPFYNLTSTEKQAKLNQLLNCDHTCLICNNVIRQTMHGLSVAWSFHPHAWEVQCGTMMTPMEVFESDTNFRKAIQKRLKYGTGRLTDASIRKGLRSFSGAQSVSNFRPSAAAAIYHTYLPEDGGTIWDMSAGYGGRLLGAITCDRVARYIGTDPCAKTMEGLRQMNSELGRDNLKVALCEVGSEDFLPERNSLDLCFTSPPYFDTEKYSDEPTQSYIKFPGKTDWLHRYLGATLNNCRRGLRPEGRLIINIANVKSYPTLEQDFIKLAISTGWTLETTLYLALSKMMGTRQVGGEKHKYEPVFVFQKV